VADQASASPELRITCFGRFQAALDGSPLVFETDKGRALLAYLAVEADQPHHRERLAGLFWSDQPEERALHNLRQTLAGLRKALGEETHRPFTQPFLLIQRDTLQFNPICRAGLDVHQFQEALHDALIFYTQRSPNAALPRSRLNLRCLGQAVEIYRGAFLEQLSVDGSPLFEEWVLTRRELYHQQAVGALELLVDACERRGDISLARQTAARLVELIPWDESACSRLMTLYALERQWKATIQQYQTFQRYVRGRLGIAPSAEMTGLFESLRRAAAQDRPPPAPYPLPRHNLPTPRGCCTDRESDLDSLAMMLADPGCHLLSLVGSDCSTKTRLALTAAHLQVGMFADGVFFVPVEGKNEPAPLVNAIAGVLGLSLTEERSSQLLDYLKDKEMLLVLDCFQDLAAGKDGENMKFIVAMLQQAAQVKLLVASPTALNLRSECVLEVI
jgi:DNA-binding SARP family transcriptional activator